jgi:hypothetical protein
VALGVSLCVVRDERIGVGVSLKLARTRRIPGLGVHLRRSGTAVDWTSRAQRPDPRGAVTALRCSHDEPSESPEPPNARHAAVADVASRNLLWITMRWLPDPVRSEGDAPITSRSGIPPMSTWELGVTAGDPRRRPTRRGRALRRPHPRHPTPRRPAPGPIAAGPDRTHRNQDTHSGRESTVGVAIRVRSRRPLRVSFGVSARRDARDGVTGRE